MHTVVRSATREVTIGHDRPFCVIGERINPTGRKKFQEELRAGDLSSVAIDVHSQVAGGATMLDVNMGAPLIDEADLLAKSVLLIQTLTTTIIGLGIQVEWNQVVKAIIVLIVCLVQSPQLFQMRKPAGAR